MLELRNVTKRFLGIAAVDDVSFSARAGEVTGYLGPNGSGKSTTMKMITGLIEMTSGEILFDGERIQRDLIAYKQRMGWSVEWVSSLANSFNQDFAVSFTADELAKHEKNYNFGTQQAYGEETPGISVFTKDGADIYRTYSTYSRGLDMLNGAYHLLDLVPKGRDEEGLSYGMEWLRRRDEYETQA